MRSLFASDSPLVRAVMLIVNVLFLNLLWLLCSLPLFTFGAATSAAYACVYKCLRHHRNDVWSEFFSCFRSDFKRTTLCWLGFLGVALVFGADILILLRLREAGRAIGNAYVLFVVLLVLEALYFLYVFTYFARFENTVKAVLTNAAILSIRSLFRTLCMFILLAAALVSMYLIPVLLFFVPVVLLWLVSLLMEPVFRKYMTEEQRKQEDELNANAREDSGRP